jgi:hypothetical protein
MTQLEKELTYQTGSYYQLKALLAKHPDFKLNLNSKFGNYMHKEVVIGHFGHLLVDTVYSVLGGHMAGTTNNKIYKYMTGQ